MRLLRPSVSVVCVLAPVLVVAACSSKTNDFDGFIEQYCSLLQPCCQPTTDGRTPGSGCVSIYTLFGGAGSFDGAAGEACLTEIRAHQAEQPFCSNVAALAPSCDKAFATKTGTKGPGETCTTSSDCAASPEGKTTCEHNVSAQSSSAMCQLVIDGKAGDAPCIGTKNGSTTSRTATGATAPRGYVCDLAHDVWCNMQSGACEATRKIGDACTNSELDACGAAGQCDGKKCVAKPPSTQPPSTDPALLLVCSTKS